MDKIKLKKIAIISAISLVVSIAVGFGTYKYNRVQAYNKLVMTANKDMEQGNYDEAITLFNQSLQYKDDANIKSSIKLANNLKEIKGFYDNGIKLVNDKKYLDAIEQFKKVTKEDDKLYSDAQKKIEECDKKFITQNIQLANDSAKNNKYDDANKYLDEVLKLDANNSEAKKLKDTFANAKASLSNNNMQPQEVNATSSGAGNIKGVITWQYNNFIGTKPDTGANIVLISKNINKNVNKNSDNRIFDLTLEQAPNGKNGIYTGKADGYGNYEIDDVPAGAYYILIKSNNTNSDMTIDSFTSSVLQGMFSEQDWNNLQNILKLNKYIFTTVEIKSDKTIIGSHDFGHTYF